MVLKKQLQQLCIDAGQPMALVRIVCKELESWMLGDLAAVEAAFAARGLAKQQNKEKYRDPDRLGGAASILKGLVPTYQKVAGARKIGPRLRIESNCSRSFQEFVRGIQRITSQ